MDLKEKYGFTFPVSSMITARPNFHYVREPVFRRMPDGSLFSVGLSGGLMEPANENVVVAVQSYDDGQTWTLPRVLFRHSERAVWATELFKEGPRPLLFVHTYHAASQYREIHTYVSTTRDSGKTWTQPQSLPCGIANVVVRQGIVLQNGRWVFPVYWQECRSQWDWGQETEKRFWPKLCGVMVSDDQGTHFQQHGWVRSSQYDLWENNVVELEPNHLMMLMRAEYAGYLYRTDSYDGGLHWGPAHQTEIPNPNSKVSFCKVGDAVVLAHNPNHYTGPTMWPPRTPLSLWVSLNGAKTWAKKIDLCIKGRFMFYPHLMWDDDRKLLYIACENGDEHFLMKLSYDTILAGIDKADGGTHA